MVKKSTDFEWEPKNKGDKIVSFLLWIILVVLIIYGALIYKNREELFNLKQVANKNKPVKEIKIHVNKNTEVEVVKTPVDKKPIIVKPVEKPVAVVKKPVVTGIKQNKPVEPDKNNTITVVNEKKDDTKMYVLKVFPFPSEKSARKFYSTLKLKMKKKLLEYKDIHALVITGFKDKEKLKEIQAKAIKHGYSSKVFENNNDAIQIDDLKKEADARDKKQDLKKTKLKELYTIQVISVRNAANAEKLKKKIIAETDIKDIFIIPSERDSIPIYKVRVGMFETKEEAEKKAQFLIDKFDEILGSWVKKGIYD